MDEESNITATYIFRGIEYVVSMNVTPSTLRVEVEDRLTADQWRGSFDAACKHCVQIIVVIAVNMSNAIAWNKFTLF